MGFTRSRQRMPTVGLRGVPRQMRGGHAPVITWALRKVGSMFAFNMGGTGCGCSDVYRAGPCA